jgi:hypothetical protein
MAANKFKSKSRYDRRSVSQSVLVSSPIWGPRSDFCYCQTTAVLSMWGALSDERTGLSFTAVKISSTCHLYLQFYMLALYSQMSESPVPCGHRLFTVLHVTLVHRYNTYIQDLCQSRLGTADHALTHVAHVTTAVLSLEWSYA